MIQCSLENLTRDQEVQLRLWLSKGDRATLQNVVSGWVKYHQIEALQAAVESKDSPNLSGKANASMRDAQRYQTFLDVLQEIVDGKRQLTIAHVK